ncbi:MAG TPA: hypothetical protein VIS99_12025 [Terrimicrobiaceae bacterium]
MMIRQIGGIGGIAREGKGKARHSIIFRPVAVGYFSLGATPEHLESRERGEDRTVQARQVIPEAASAKAADIPPRRIVARMFRRFAFDRLNSAKRVPFPCRHLLHVADVGSAYICHFVRAVHPVRKDGVSRSLFLRDSH